MSIDMPDRSGEIMTHPASYAIGLLHEVRLGADLRVYPGAPHGLYATHTAEVNADLLAFLGYS